MPTEAADVVDVADACIGPAVVPVETAVAPDSGGPLSNEGLTMVSPGRAHRW